MNPLELFAQFQGGSGKPHAAYLWLLIARYGKLGTAEQASDCLLRRDYYYKPPYTLGIRTRQTNADWTLIGIYSYIRDLGHYSQKFSILRDALLSLSSK
jgi:hypothetical protein